jgi:subtilisin family serine protease
LLAYWTRGLAADQWFEDLRFVQEIVGDHDDDQKPVRVAILDTGIDETHPFVKEALGRVLHKPTRVKQIAAMRGFPNHLKPGQDHHGHGTHCASVFIKTAPNAALYIARVADDTGRIDQGINDQDEFSHVAEVN